MTRNLSLGVLRGIALGIPLYFVAAHLWAWVLIAPGFFHRADFRQFYVGAYMMRTGEANNLYNFERQTELENRLVSVEPEKYELPFVSPAYHAVLLSPLSFLPYRAAYLSMAGVNLALLTVCCVLLWPYLANVRTIYPWLPFAMFLGFYPVAWAMIHGQDSILLMTLLTASFISLKRGRETLAGALLAIGLFKFQIVIPIALLFLVWRRWKFTLSFSSCAIALAAVSVWLTGFAQTKLYIGSLFAVALTPNKAGIASHPVLWTMMPNINGIMVGIFGSTLQPQTIKVAALLTSIIFLAYVARKGVVIESARLLLLAIPAAILVGGHTYMHDVSPALLTIVILLNDSLPAVMTAGAIRTRAVCWIAALTFAAPFIDSFFPTHSYLAGFAIFALAWAAAIMLQDHREGSLYRPAKKVIPRSHSIVMGTHADADLVGSRGEVRSY